MIILRLLLLLTKLHLKLLSTQGTGANKLLSTQRVKDFKVAWRKIKRRIWKLPYMTQNAIVHNLSYNINFQIDTRMIKFIHSCLNHSNIVCKSIVLPKLYCIKSTFGSNYKYLSVNMEFHRMIGIPAQVS